MFRARLNKLDTEFGSNPGSGSDGEDVPPSPTRRDVDVTLDL